MTSIADTFARQIAELEERHKESERKTQRTLQRVHALIEELQAMEFDSDDGF
jgi:predicted secreted Zn-dependent protease